MTFDNNTINNNPMGVVGDLKGSKPTYEIPRMIPLGDLARGSGLCWTGTGPADGICTNGVNALTSCGEGSTF